MGGSVNLSHIAAQASGAEQEACLRQSSWVLLLSAIAILLRRLESNTLLPGAIREEEMDYGAYEKAAISKGKNEPGSLPAVLRSLASVMWYGTLLMAMRRSLDLMRLFWWSVAQKRSVESVVLRGLDVIPRITVLAHTIADEDDLVATIERRMNSRNYDAAFCASVLRKWRSEAVSSVLRARGALQTGIAMLNRAVPSLRPESASTSRSTACATAPFPLVPRRRRRSRSLRDAPAVALWCTAAWSIKRWTGGRTKRRAVRRRRRGWLKRKRRRKRVAGLRHVESHQGGR